MAESVGGLLPPSQQLSWHDASIVDVAALIAALP